MKLAEVASEKFHVTIVPQTLRKLLREGRDQILPSGPKPRMNQEEFDTISAAVCSYVAIGQLNGEPEKKRSDLISSMKHLLKGNEMYNELTLFLKIKKANASSLELSKEEVVEMRRQMWTTFSNLTDWFDAWEDFALRQGFATKEGESTVCFSEDQKRRIINIDETNLSLDGADGGHGGRPACSITIKNCNRPGTAQNKSSISSSLMCGSNAAREAMSIHIMFSSDAKEESNYAVNAAWILDLPRVTAQFGHDEEKTFAASVTTNEKGGTDGRVLKQVLNHYVTQLFPDAADIPGKRVLFKIDGGPGRLDISNLAELRSRGVYLFPGVQNTTHITQETDQNYGEFKTLLRKYIQQLLNELYAKYREQVQQQHLAVSNAPLAAPTLNRSHYGVLLGGREANEDESVAPIPPIFHLCFSKEKNLRSWEACGAVPLTRAPLNHSSVRHELEQRVESEQLDDSDAEVLIEYRAGDYDWASKTLQDLVMLNHASCKWLDEHGFNGKALKINGNVRPRTLTNTRVPKDAPLEVRIKAMVASGISLSSLFYTIGPSCLSVDEIFIAFEYREREKQFNVEKREYEKVLKKKEIEDKAKSVLAQNKTTYTKSELTAILKWRLGDNFTEHRNKRISDLQLLFAQTATENPPEILLPPAPQEPSVPNVNDTELGRARRQQFQTLLQMSQQYDNSQLQQLAAVIMGLCNDRGVEMNPV